MNLNSQICTTCEQSERLLALGLKIATADCIWCKVRTLSKDEPIQWHLLPEYIDKYDEKHIPAWSLHRLIEIFKSGINISEYIVCSNAYDEIVDDIEYEIKIGRFNKEYLEE